MIKVCPNCGHEYDTYTISAPTINVCPMCGTYLTSDSVGVAWCG